MDSQETNNQPSINPQVTGNKSEGFYSELNQELIPVPTSEIELPELTSSEKIRLMESGIKLPDIPEVPLHSEELDIPPTEVIVYCFKCHESKIEEVKTVTEKCLTCQKEEFDRELSKTYRQEALNYSPKLWNAVRQDNTMQGISIDLIHGFLNKNRELMTRSFLEFSYSERQELVQYLQEMQRALKGAELSLRQRNAEEESDWDDVTRRAEMKNAKPSDRTGIKQREEALTEVEKLMKKYIEKGMTPEKALKAAKMVLED